MASYKPYAHHQPQQSLYCIRLRKIPSFQLANHIKMDIEYLAPPEELYSITLMPSKFEDNTYIMYINFYLQKTARECGEYIISQQYSNEIILNEQKYTPAHQQETKIELISPLDIYFSKFQHSIADTIGECYELTRNTIVLNRKLSTAETSQKKKDLAALLRTIIWAPTSVAKQLLPYAEKYVKLNAQHTCIIFKQEKEECFNLKYSAIFSIICLCGRESEVKVLQSALDTPLYYNLKLTQKAYEVITSSKPINSNTLEIESKRCNVLCINNQPNLELSGYTQEDIDAFVQAMEQITNQIQYLLGDFIDKTKIKFCSKCLLQNFLPVCDMLNSIEDKYQITLSRTLEQESNDISVSGAMEALIRVEMEYIAIQNNICANIISKLSSFKTPLNSCIDTVSDLTIRFIEYHMKQEDIFTFYQWEYDQSQNETTFQMEFIGLAAHVNSLAAKFETIQPMTDKLRMNQGDMQHFNSQRAAFSDIESDEFVKFYSSPDGKLIYYCSLSVSSKSPLELFDGAMYQQEGDRKISLLQMLVFYLTKRNLLNSCERQFNCKIVCLPKENTNEAHSRENRQNLLIKGKRGDIFKAIEHLKQLEKSFIIIPVHLHIELKFLSFYKKEVEALQIIFQQREKIIIDINEINDDKNKLHKRNKDSIDINLLSLDHLAGKEEVVKEFKTALAISSSDAQNISENQAKKIEEAIKVGALGKGKHYYINLFYKREKNFKKHSVIVFTLDFFKNEIKQGLEEIRPYILTTKENYSFPPIFADMLFYSKEYKECVKSNADLLGIEYQLPKTWSDKFTFTGDILNIRSLKSEMKKFELKFLQKCHQISIEVNMPFDRLQRDANYKQIENDLLRYNLIKIYLEHEFPDNIEEKITSLSLEMSEINPNFYCHSPSVTNTSTDIQYNQVLGSFLAGNSINVEVMKTDITKLNIDCIVNASNNRLDHCGSVAKAIDAGVPSIQKGCTNHIIKNTLLETGAGLIQKATGSLSCNKIIHTLAPIWDSHNPTLSSNALRNSVARAIKAAANQGLTSIALPGISAGVFGFPPDASATNIINGISDYAMSTPQCCIKRIVLVDVNDSIVKSFLQACRLYLRHHSSNLESNSDELAIYTEGEDLALPILTEPHMIVKKSLFSIVKAMFISKPKPQSKLNSTPSSFSSPDSFFFSWKDDNGNFCKYDDVNMKILQNSYILNASVPVTIENGDYKYLIDFKTKQQKNLSTNKVRNINISSQFNSSNNLSVQAATKIVDFNTFGCTWYFFNDQNTWVPYSQELCDKLNESYLNDQNGSVNVTLNDFQYEINFAKMTQKNCETKKVRKIQVNRDGLDVKIDAWSTATCQNLILYGPRDELHAAKNKLIHLIEESTTTENIDMQDIPKSMMFSTIDELKKKFSYIKFSIIDSTATVPTPKNCLYTIKIEGFNDEVNKAQAIISEKRIKFLHSTAPNFSARTTSTSQSDFSNVFPSTWDPMPSSKILHLVNIKTNSNEWKDVASKFNVTASNQIRLIKRIQNVWLWKKYQFAKKQLEEKHKGTNIGINELKVFHGTGINDPELVYSGEEGFDMRYSNKGMWGMANYFAVNASYSVNYSYITSRRLSQMLLVRILAGDVITAKPDSLLRMPPYKNADGKFLCEKYDTVTGDTRGSKVYMLYTNERAYPEYLITFLE